jgi:Ammonium Transporter Family
MLCLWQVQALSHATYMVIAPSIVFGAAAERIKFGAGIVMASLWLPVVLFPIAHAVWAGPGSLLGDLGTLDFAGTEQFVPLSHTPVDIASIKKRKCPMRLCFALPNPKVTSPHVLSDM